MINEKSSLDGKVEAVLLTTMSGDELVKVAHGVYLHVNQFAQVRPVGDDPEHAQALKTLRTQIVEERLAAASARSETTMAKQEADEARAATRRVGHELGKAVRQYELARAALEHIQRLDAAGPLAPLTFLDVLLPTGRKGSLDVPCDAVLTINRRVPGCGCDEPCWEEVTRHPCFLPLGHEHFTDAKEHQTIGSTTFATGDVDYIGEETD